MTKNLPKEFRGKKKSCVHVKIEQQVRGLALPLFPAIPRTLLRYSPKTEAGSDTQERHVKQQGATDGPKGQNIDAGIN